MKKKILSIGSCQSTMLVRYLNEIPEFVERYETYIPEKQVYAMDDGDIDRLLALLPEIDILLIQPVTQNYVSQKQKKHPPGTLASSRIIEAIKPGGQVIMFPVLFFGAYFPSYIRPGMRMPSDNHDSNLLHMFANAYESNVVDDGALIRILDRYIEIVSDAEFYSASTLEMQLHSGFESLAERERNATSQKHSRQVNFISMQSFFRKLCCNDLLLLTCNHPSHTTYNYLASRTLEVVDISHHEFTNLNPHAEDAGILYQSLRQIVDFDPSKFQPSLKGIHDVRGIATLYLDEYRRDPGRARQLAMRHTAYGGL